MQPTTHVLDLGAEARECSRLEIDVTELDRCTDESAVLPLGAALQTGHFVLYQTVNWELISDPILLEAQRFEGYDYNRHKSVFLTLLVPREIGSPMQRPDVRFSGSSVTPIRRIKSRSVL